MISREDHGQNDLRDGLYLEETLSEIVRQIRNIEGLPYSVPFYQGLMFLYTEVDEYWDTYLKSNEKERKNK